MMVHNPSVCNSWDWPRPRATNSIWVCHLHLGQPNHLGHQLLPPRHISMKLDWKHRTAENQTRHINMGMKIYTRNPKWQPNLLPHSTSPRRNSTNPYTYTYKSLHIHCNRHTVMIQSAKT